MKINFLVLIFLFHFIGNFNLNAQTDLPDLGPKIPIGAGDVVDKGKKFEIVFADNNNHPWKLIFYMGPSFTTYGQGSIKYDDPATNTNLTIHGVVPETRNSMDFYAFWNYPFKDWLRWIDEPTNTFMVLIQTGPHEFGLQLYHPKYVMVNGYQEIGIGSYQAEGNLNGQPINEQLYIYTPPQDNPNAPSLNFFKLEHSYAHLFWGIRYAYMIALDGKSNSPRFHLGLGATLGMYTGFSRQQRYTLDGQVVESEVNQLGNMGYGGSLNQRLNWQSKNGNFQVFIENRGEFARLVYDVVPSGKITQMLFSDTLNFGVAFKIFQKK